MLATLHCTTYNMVAQLALHPVAGESTKTSDISVIIGLDHPDSINLTASIAVYLSALRTIWLPASLDLASIFRTYELFCLKFRDTVLFSRQRWHRSPQSLRASRKISVHEL